MSAWDVPSVTAVTDLGEGLLDDIESFLNRFVVYPSEHSRVAHVLWIAHTWFMDQWESTPRIAFLSPEPGSGKSRALEVTEPLVPRPVHAVNASSSALFRKVADPDGRPTILFDEIDTIFGPRAKENEDLRGLLNAGHRVGATTLRSVVRGKEISVEEFPSYCAVALAGLDDLPDTIMTRSVVVRMRRRGPGEKVEPWRRRVNGPEAEALCDRLIEWSNIHQQTIDTWPQMPDGVEDRNADVWEALLAVADLAGGDWPERARVAAVTAVTDSRETKTTMGVMLLRDLRSIFTTKDTDRIPTVELLDALNGLDESPWGDIRGRELDARALSRRLSKYDIKPTTFRIGESTAKGYLKSDLVDAWSRYLSPVPELGNTGNGGNEVATDQTGVTSGNTPQVATDQQVSHVGHLGQTPEPAHGGDAVSTNVDTEAGPPNPNQCSWCGRAMLLSHPSNMHPNCEAEAAAEGGVA